MVTVSDAKSELSMLEPRRPAISDASCWSSSRELRSDRSCCEASRTPRPLAIGAAAAQATTCLRRRSVLARTCLGAGPSCLPRPAKY